ncbi:MAG: S1C family serine protease [Vicinamibacterales bacterium]
MGTLLASLSEELAAAVATVAPSVVQVHGARRAQAGLVFDADLVMTAGRHLDGAAVSVRAADGRVLEGTLLGHGRLTGLAVVRVPGLGSPAADAAPVPAPGHLAQAVGRTWSGGVFAAFAPVAVVGGPLRTGRRAELPRVIRVGIAPHGALVGGALVDGAGRVLGLVTGTAIRATTLVVPSEFAWADARQVVAHADHAPGYLGIRSMPVRLPESQRAGRAERGLLVTGVSDGGPAATAGVLVGDVLVACAGMPVDDPDDLLARLREVRPGEAVALTLSRGGTAQELAVTAGERPRG